MLERMVHKLLQLALETKCYEVRAKKFAVLVYVHIEYRLLKIYNAILYNSGFDLFI